MPSSPAIRPCPLCTCDKSHVTFITDALHVVTCSNCSFVFTGNPPDEQALYEHYYEQISPNAHIYNNESPSPSVREIFFINRARAAKIRSIAPTGSVLDIGCGPGYFLKTIVNEGFAAHGLEVSTRAAAFAREQFDLTITQGTIDTAAKNLERYDIITMWHVLEHFLDPVSTLTKIRHLLKNDGLLIIEVPNLHSLKFMLKKNRWQGGNHPQYHKSFFTSSTLSRCLKMAGFHNMARLGLCYTIPGMSRHMHYIKKTLNQISMDSFLSYATTAGLNLRQ